jgi:hypothetical protein
VEQAAQVSVPVAPHVQARVPVPPGPPQVPVQSAVQVVLGKQAATVPPSPAGGPPPVEQAAQVSVPFAPHVQLRVPVPPGPQVPVQSAVQDALLRQAPGPVPPSPAGGPPPQPVQVSLPVAPQVQVLVPAAPPGQAAVQSAVQVAKAVQTAGGAPLSPAGGPPVEQAAQVSVPFPPHVHSRVPVPPGPQVAVQSAVQVMPLPQVAGAAASACGGVVVLPPVASELPPVASTPPLDPPVFVVDPPVLVVLVPPALLLVPPEDCPALAAPSLPGAMPLELQPIPIAPKNIADIDRTPNCLN